MRCSRRTTEPAPAAASRRPPRPPQERRAPASPPAGASDAATLAAAAAVEGNLISIDDFLRVDLRVAKVLHAELVAGADKLLKLRVDVGELGEREIFAGIRAAYDPASLVGPAHRRRRQLGAAQNALRHFGGHDVGGGSRRQGHLRVVAGLRRGARHAHQMT